MDNDDRVATLHVLKQQIFDLYQQVSLVSSVVYFAGDTTTYNFFSGAFTEEVRRKLEQIEGSLLLISAFGDSE